ncbi:OLC1v1002395C1 [Oldenlandia corymbosa var. corymbosa]|uniref:OLC1v1002395C1 n=1 Tax=Oldenlandia corymbosa var. corymbosa TaxID=529605 RepID=A0AAV1DA08_OLDCO|nr:OLC1v1002395C1 [Oldenlandia corymbosa var. corymbosa]
MERLVKKLFNEAEKGAGVSWRRLVPRTDAQRGQSCLPMAMSGAISTKKNIVEGLTDGGYAKRLCPYDLYALMGGCASTRLQASIAAGLWGFQYPLSMWEDAYQNQVADRVPPPPHHVFDEAPFSLDPSNPLIYLEDFLVATSIEAMAENLMQCPGVTVLQVPNKLRRLYMDDDDQPHPNAFKIHKLKSKRKSTNLERRMVQDNPHKPLYHAFLVVGYCPEKKYFILQNSWSYRWGLGGFIKVHEDFIHSIWFPTELGESPSSKLPEWMNEYRVELETNLAATKELYKTLKEAAKIKKKNAEKKKKKETDDFERTFQHYTGWKIWVLDRLRVFEGDDMSEFEELCIKWGCSPDGAPNLWMDQ